MFDARTQALKTGRNRHQQSLAPSKKQVYRRYVEAPIALRLRRVLCVAALALAGLVMATDALAVDQTPKNGCASPVSYEAALTSPGVSVGENPSLEFQGFFEIESINPAGFDQLVVEWTPASVIDWQELTSLNPTSSSGGQTDIGFSNIGLGARPEFQSFGPFSIPAQPNDTIMIRFRFSSGDNSYQGFRGWGIDDVVVPAGSFTESFEGGSEGWEFGTAAGEGAPSWQTLANSDTITVESPEIAPDLVTLPDGDDGSLPDTPAGDLFAWFGDPASGTYCGPDFANRFEEPGQTGPTGQTGSTGQTGTTGQGGQVGQARRVTLADLPKPVLGKVANVEPAKGTVLVAIPAGKAAASASVGEAIASQKGLKFVPLAEARQIPVGSFLDTRKGTVRLQAASTGKAKPYLGSFSAGLFQMRQSRRRSAKGLTSLVMKGGKFKSCAAKRGKRASAALSKKRLRRLRGKGRGRFRTRGRYSAATVRGTTWTVTDRCDGTLTQVSRGKVAVRDFRRKKTIVLRAGKRYLARAKR